MTDSIVSSVEIGPNEAIWPVCRPERTLLLQCSRRNVNQERSLKADIPRTQILTPVCLSMLSVSLSVLVRLHFSFVASFVCAFCLYFFRVFISFNVFGRSFSWFISYSFLHLFLPTLLSLSFLRSLVGHLFLVSCALDFCLRLCISLILFPFLG